MILTLLLLLILTTSASGQDAVAPFIGGANHTVSDSNQSSVTEGLLLIGELGCTSCHMADADAASWIFPRRAPRLDQVAKRIQPGHLLEFIRNPAISHPGTVMPAMLADFSPDAQQEIARSLVDYLVTRSGSTWQPTVPDRVAIEEGERLYHQVGCVSCHEPLRETAITPLHSNRLIGRIEHWSQPQLSRFLRDPHSVRPSGRMPSLGLNGREAAAIAHFLLRETKVAAPLDLTIDRGHRKGLDDSSRSRPWKTTVAAGFQLPQRQRGNDVTTHFSGWLRIEQAGDYHFYLKVDDIGRLRIDDQNVIDLGETKNYQRKKVVESDASIHLEAGLHRIEVSHFQWVEDAILELDWQGPGIDRGPIDPSFLSNYRESLPPRELWNVESDNADRGKDLYVKLGCAQCHEEGATGNATELGKLTGPLPHIEHPRYQLTSRQAQDLQTALTFLRDDPQPPDPQQRVDLTMRTFRCIACHSRGDLGGVPVDRRDFFTGTDPLLGDEGRIPPPLSGVGDKLQYDWLDGAIRRGRSVRGYVNTRMPHFNHAQTLTLASDLIAVDRQATAVPRLIHDSETARSAGHQMAGVGMLQCVLCHDFNQKQSVGMRAMDLVTTTERLNRDWFHRYMLDPESLRPGTQMLAFWPDGRSIIPELLDGDAGQQVQAIWRYLEDGQKAVFPEGLSRQQKELIVGGEAIVYRGKLWEAGFRGIAVGLPEGIHYAFDAQELRLALLWKGRFLDARAHWSSQGMGRIRPLGQDVITFPRGPDIVFLTDVFCPWPGGRQDGVRPPGYRFRGYRLGDRGIPTLMYSTEALDIEETLLGIDVPGGANLLRKIQIEKNEHPGQRGLYYLRLRDIPPEEVLDDGTCIYADGLHIRVVETSPRTRAKPVYTIPEKWETWIRLPIYHDETTTLAIEYRWGKENR